MKLSDIDRLRDDGLVSADQHRAIVERYSLDREGNRLLAILGILGGILVTAGAVLLVAANWDEVPKAVKIVGGLLLMLGAHGVGWRFGRSGTHPAMAATFHLVGAGLFLANIGLVGQVYHLSSRPQNAILLWLAGIAPLPWILRSRALLLLTLSVFGVWLGTELVDSEGLLHFGGEARMCSLYLALAVVFIGAGRLLRGGRFPEFAGPTEKFGLLAVHHSAFPLMLGFFYRQDPIQPAGWWVAAVVATIGFGLVLRDVFEEDPDLPRQWRWVWLGALVGILFLASAGLGLHQPGPRYGGREAGPHWLVLPAMFAFSLLQIRVGLHRRIPFFVNLAIVSIAVQILTAYLQLFGTMADTGLIFVSTGVLLIGLGWYLERQRRSLVRSMSATAPSATKEESR